ncbi:hypothetical protein [Lacicoccus qingdaonensis]|uniref:Uncharacterized protein n=1 Tax=Lacicoccus qingdaonensis TaxID=576118 RepID=A0A1G9I2I1_9BACL|nr:hypothetical protein [Salinicoccus qingdaonensis]SDL19450.1 hypothetical protein SAMN05216216_12915 [Salinicoccus qingdaonensis]
MRKILATVLFFLGTLLMFGTMTIIPEAWVIPSYIGVALLFIVGLYMSYSAEL